MKYVSLTTFSNEGRLSRSHLCVPVSLFSLSPPPPTPPSRACMSWTVSFFVYLSHISVSFSAFSLSLLSVSLYVFMFLPVYLSPPPPPSLSPCVRYFSLNIIYFFIRVHVHTCKWKKSARSIILEIPYSVRSEGQEKVCDRMKYNNITFFSNFISLPVLKKPLLSNDRAVALGLFK